MDLEQAVLDEVSDFSMEALLHLILMCLSALVMSQFGLSLKSSKYFMEFF